MILKESPNREAYETLRKEENLRLDKEFYCLMKNIEIKY